MTLDFSEEINIAVEALAWRQTPEERAQLIRQCSKNGLKAEWRLTKDGWELRIAKARNQ